MRFIKFFLAIAVIALVSACSSSESQLSKAEKAIDKGEYVKAAEALSKIEGDDLADWVEDQSTYAMRTFMAVAIIYSEGNSRATNILEDWSGRIEKDIDEDDLEGLFEKFNNFY